MTGHKSNWLMTLVVALLLAIGGAQAFAQSCGFDSDCKGNSGKCGNSKQ